MRKLTRFAAFVLLVALGTSNLQAWELDDSVIAPQIQIAVVQYRQALLDFEKLKGSLVKGGVDEAEIADYPSVKHFEEATLNPAESQLRSICRRYEADFGPKAMKKMAKRHQFEDLLH